MQKILNTGTTTNV